MVLSSFMNYHRVCIKSNTTGATCVTGTAFPSVAPEFTPGFSWIRVAQSLVFHVVYCRSLFVLFLLLIVLSVLRFTASAHPSVFLMIFQAITKHACTKSGSLRFSQFSSC
jgi:hypothetical protein